MENIVYYTSLDFGHVEIGMIYRRSLPLNIFVKAATCPAAEDIIAFSKSLLPLAQIRLVRAHLAECDFCRAELQLLERYPCTPEAVPVGEMPASLRVLAESILGSPARTFPPRSLASRRAISH